MARVREGDISSGVPVVTPKRVSGPTAYTGPSYPSTGDNQLPPQYQQTIRNQPRAWWDQPGSWYSLARQAGMSTVDAMRWGMVNLYAPLRGLNTTQQQPQPYNPYFGNASVDVYNQQRQRYLGLYPNGGNYGSNIVNPLVPQSVPMPDTQQGQQQRIQPGYNAYVPPEIQQYYQQDAARRILPTGTQDHALSKFARDARGGFALNPYGSGEIDPYSGFVRANTRAPWQANPSAAVFDANSMFWDPFAQSPGGPRNWPTVDATAPAGGGGYGGYGGYGWGGGGGGGGNPEWYDRAAKWSWGKEA